VLILMVSMIVLVTGLGAVSLSRSNIRSTVATRDWSEAGLGASSGIEYALAVMNTSPTWRSDAASGTPIGPITVGRSAAIIALVDESDADLDDDNTQPVRVYSVAKVGAAARAYSLLCAPSSTTGMDVLRCPVHSAGNITVAAAGAAVVSGGPLSANNQITNSAALVSDIETNTLNSSGYIQGFVQTGMPAKAMPGTTAWTALAATATTIPWGSTGGTIDRAVLGPGINTVGGGVNASGVYAINVPILSTLTIRRSRICATLLITLSASSALVVKDENAWDPPSTSKPALLVRGGLFSSANLGGSSASTVLSEPDNATNYNPAGAPFNSLTDTDTADTYPCELHGLFHFIDAATAVTISSNVRVVGSIIVQGNATINTTATLTASPTLMSSPPTGYAAVGPMTPVPGTYRWEVADVNP
jgi:hypothetical protein